MTERRFKDQMGEVIHLTGVPRRIVSLVPSQTELLFDLGVDERIVGVTWFCTRPEEGCREKEKVGGTKRFKFDRINNLEPDLIIGNKEENYREGIEKLRAEHPVWMSDIYTLEDVYNMMRSLGEILHRADKSEEVVSGVKERMSSLDWYPEVKAAYFIWREPYMVAGKDTFIDEMMEKCGFINVFGDSARYPEVSLEMVRKAEPEIILLSSEPFPFRDEHLRELNTYFPSTELMLVDGQMFSWYGTRLLFAADYFKSLRARLFGT